MASTLHKRALISIRSSLAKSGSPWWLARHNPPPARRSSEV